MRRKVLLVVTAAFLAVLTPSAEAVKSSAKKIPVTYSLKVAVNSATGKANLTVRFTRSIVVKTAVGTKRRLVSVKVPSTLTTRYIGYDSFGAICGAKLTLVRGSSFIARPLGAYRLVIKTSIALNSSRYRLLGKQPMPRKLVLGGKSAMCGTPSTVPIAPPEVLAPPSLCPGSDQIIAPFCGRPSLPEGKPALPGVCQWATQLTLNKSTGLVSTGRVVCPVGNCWVEPLRGAPSTSWLGATIPTTVLKCSDGTYVFFPLRSVSLSNTGSEKASCGPFSPLGPPIASFTVPSSWSGTLVVKWLIGTDKNGVTQGAELAAASFELGGSQNGCPQLSSDPNTRPGS